MKVKICGITHPQDAEYAVGLGADYIGIIFAESSKRKVGVRTAKEISLVAISAGAEPVGVFANETPDEIISVCKETGIFRVQLHGEISRQAVHYLHDYLSIIYTIPVEKNGILLQNESLPPTVTILYDSLKAGSGETFEWADFSPPGNFRWILAGGLNPDNVATAIALLNPYGVDVATGVEYPNTTRKDPALVKAFIHAANLSRR